MESRANYAAVGLFVLAMIVAGLAFLYWLTNSGEQARQALIRVVFNGPVTGLNTGAAVLFNGIRVGDVVELTLDETDPNTVIALIRVDRTKPIRTDTKAQLSFQGLTGVSNLQLEGGSRNAPLLLDATEGNEGIPTIVAEVSPFQDIIATAREVVTEARQAVNGVNSIVSDNGPAISRTIENVERFSGALAANSDGIGQALASVSEVANSLGTIAGDLRGSAQRAGEILQAVDPQRVADLVDNLVQSSERLDSVLTTAQEITAGIDSAAVNAAIRDVADAATGLKETVDQAKSVVAAIDPAEVDGLITSLRSTSDSIGDSAARASELLASVDSAAIQRIVTQVDTTTANLAEVSKTVGGVIERAGETFGKVGDVVAAVDPAKVRSTIDDVASFAGGLKDITPQVESILADARSASESLRRLGETIDKRQGDVDATIAGARGLVDQLNGIASRADGILADFGEDLEGGGEGLIAEASATLKSIRSVADKLDQSIGPIASNVQKFTDRGLSGYTQLAEEGRRALSRLDRVLAGIERNPQQFIFGGDRAPEYAPRRR